MNLALVPPPRARRAAAKRPPLVLIESEADALFDLAIRWQRLHPLSAELLLDELNRATTVAPADLPDDVVTMRSRVTFVEAAGGEPRTVQLVYPSEADMAHDRVSIMTPIGAALIGMRVGSAIDWPNRQGEPRRLEIVGVVQPGSEAAA
jgi:regulator of nucleoside diphosphate kinase